MNNDLQIIEDYLPIWAIGVTHRGRNLFGKGIFQRVISGERGGHSSSAGRRFRSIAANHMPEK
jgi:hypothetical protein